MLAKEIICLHPQPNPELGSIDLYKYYNNNNNDNNNDMVDETILNSQDEEIILE